MGFCTSRPYRNLGTTYVFHIFISTTGDIPDLAWRPDPNNTYIVCLPIFSLSSRLILLFSWYVIPRCFNFFTLFIYGPSKVYSELTLLFFFAIRMTSVFPGFSFTRSRLVLYCTTSIMTCISVLGPSRTISSAHAGEATHMSPNFALSVLIVRLLRIVLLYLLYKRVDSFAPCRIPCAMLILFVRLLFHLTLNVIPLYMLFIRVHISPSTPSYKVC